MSIIDLPAGNAHVTPEVIAAVLQELDTHRTQHLDGPVPREALFQDSIEAVTKLAVPTAMCLAASIAVARAVMYGAESDDLLLTFCEDPTPEEVLTSEHRADYLQLQGALRLYEYRNFEFYPDDKPSDMVVAIEKSILESNGAPTWLRMFARAITATVNSKLRSSDRANTAGELVCAWSLAASYAIRWDLNVDEGRKLVERLNALGNRCAERIVGAGKTA